MIDHVLQKAIARWQLRAAEAPNCVGIHGMTPDDAQAAESVYQELVRIERDGESAADALSRWRDIMADARKSGDHGAVVEATWVLGAIEKLA